MSSPSTTATHNKIDTRSDGSTFGYETEDILNRTKMLDVKLDSAETEVLASFAGLRPSRQAGNRIEKVFTQINGEHRALVHNYGAGGTGFQAGYGMALDAVGMVEDVLKELATDGPKARL